MSLEAKLSFTIFFGIDYGGHAMVDCMVLSVHFSDRQVSGEVR